VRPGLAEDPLWYKDAVIYQVHVRGFFDRNDDGVGDFPGLTEKLDYIQSLGVSAIWLLPFYPSPLKDDGYDIAHYEGVHPPYGTRRDFLTFLNEAHARGIRVITELVINHTSDQHPWFQAARRAKPGTSKRNFYVWSDTPDKYAGVPVVFKDTEPSNWSWDPIAGAYYWHRFFHHQPDLNFDNPVVQRAVLKVMRFWLQMGVDGMRLDAVPYLVEREGTQCANLPETHAILKGIRRELDGRFRHRMLLAEANQWPSDVRTYFGDGDECHMAFHFPLMPRLFMALRQEDRHPISEILWQMPEIPETCQWAIFLRNHDELTLEMVSDEERDYMYEAYAADPQMRLNAGIRRRLAPLMENSRPRIELLHGLLLSLPGTPIIYYGDELGMGDNVYLGDRNGVRTPMQWNADRNGGFSRADPARLYAPPIMDSVYGYQAVNVEAQDRSPHSLLNWMRRIIALRQQYPAFGRGTMELLRPLNRRVLAFVRRHGDDDPILVVANLSRTVQPVSLDLSRLAGLVPVEMSSGVDLPRITEAPYFVTLGPYGFMWLILRRDAPAPSGARTPLMVAEPEPDQAPLLVGPEWWKLLDGSVRQMLEQRYLPSYLRRQPWFDVLGRTLARVTIADWGLLRSGDEPVLIVMVDAEFADGVSARYAVPLTATPIDRSGDIVNRTPETIVTQLAGARKGILHTRLDGVAGRALISVILGGRTLPLRHGRLRAVQFPALAELALPERIEDLPPEPFDFERFHSSAVFGERVILKAHRRAWPGSDPEPLMSALLREQAGFTRVAAVGGAVEYEGPAGAAATIALLHSYIPHQTDGWRHALDELERFLDLAATLGEPPTAPRDVSSVWTLQAPEVAHQTMGGYLKIATTLGHRTALLHAALTHPAVIKQFGQGVLDEPGIVGLAERTAASWERARVTLLSTKYASASDPQAEAVNRLLSRQDQIRYLAARSRAEIAPGSVLHPVHGNLDLAHVLMYEGDFWFIGLAGNAAEHPDRRRRMQSPFQDLASVLRSFHTAAGAALARRSSTTAPQQLARLHGWARCWAWWASASFLQGYRREGFDERAYGGATSAVALLRLLLLERTFEEIIEYLSGRPEWLPVALEAAGELLAEENL
jgi:maltose alpha-D-glucosyltransferase/alpha-amylase